MLLIGKEHPFRWNAFNNFGIKLTSAIIINVWTECCQTKATSGSCYSVNETHEWNGCISKNVALVCYACSAKYLLYQMLLLVDGNCWYDSDQKHVFFILFLQLLLWNLLIFLKRSKWLIFSWILIFIGITFLYS